MTISHVIYLEFARLIVSWQWVTEVIYPRYFRATFSMPALNQSSPKVPGIYTAATSFVFPFFPSPLPRPFLYVDTTPYVDTPRM